MTAVSSPERPILDPGRYSLVGPNAAEAVTRGLADADWYQSPVPRETMRELLERRDGPAIRDTLIWFGLLGAAGIAGFQLWGSWWAVLPFAIYGVIYGSTSDSRWHESSHGTAFKTDWMNNVLYEISSFMVMRESTVWRWSHMRHHSDTIVVGRDPEIAIPCPPNITKLLLGFVGLPNVISYFCRVSLHCLGRLDPEEATYIPESDHAKIFLKARLSMAIYAGVIGLSIFNGSILPLMFIGFPNIYGAWLQVIYGLTQHAGLAENVLDHRMNCRTLAMDPINRFLYWNMNYHVEHHMFPLVPYHNLPRLHRVVLPDMPKPYGGLIDAWSEMIPAVWRQRKDPGYFVKRRLPTPTVPHAANQPAKVLISKGREDEDGWIEIGDVGLLHEEDVLRFDHGERTYAICQTSAGRYHATDGMCTHGNTHLATGLVKGNLIECPKHNGRFDVRDGAPKRLPACLALRTHPVREIGGRLQLRVGKPGGDGAAPAGTTHRFKVISSRNVATFIRELIVEPVGDSPALDYRAGQYLQFDIPAYGTIPFSGLAVDPPYNTVWEAQHVFEFEAENHVRERRNYSLASNPGKDSRLMFNIRIATPPRGQDCRAGSGSAYMWNLKPGDTVTAVGPLGDFVIKDTSAEMVYLGGGSGMAPLRSHLSHLFETLKTGRKVSFWYGARSRQELFYQDYFEGLARRFSNFTYQPALSEPLPTDDWESHTGLIHEVLKREYLARHAAPGVIEYYLCGPQPLIQSARKLLGEMGVSGAQIAFDEF